jgi:hypothetical protein
MTSARLKSPALSVTQSHRQPAGQSFKSEPRCQMSGRAILWTRVASNAGTGAPYSLFVSCSFCKALSAQTMYRLWTKDEYGGFGRRLSWPRRDAGGTEVKNENQCTGRNSNRELRKYTSRALSLHQPAQWLHSRRTRSQRLMKNWCKSFVRVLFSYKDMDSTQLAVIFLKTPRDKGKM